MLKQKKYMNNALFITLGALITVFAAWYQQSKQREKDQKVEQLNKENKDLLVKMDSTSRNSYDAILASNQSLQKVTEELIAAHKTIDSLRDRSLSIVKGTGCPLVIVERDPEERPRYIKISLLNDQVLPINHLEVTFIFRYDMEFDDVLEQPFQFTQYRTTMPSSIPWTIYHRRIPKYYTSDDKSIPIADISFKVNWGADHYDYRTVIVNTESSTGWSDYKILNGIYIYHGREYDQKEFEKNIRPKLLNKFN